MIDIVELPQTTNPETVRLYQEFMEFHMPLTPEFRSTMSEMTSETLLKVGEDAGFFYTQPHLKFDHLFNHSFNALFDDKLVLISVFPQNDNLRRDGYRSALQFDLVRLQDWVDELHRNTDEGVFSGSLAPFRLKEELYLQQNESLGPSTPAFVRGILQFLREVPDDVLIKGKAADEKRYASFMRIFNKHLGHKKNFRMYK